MPAEVGLSGRRYQKSSAGEAKLNEVILLYPAWKSIEQHLLLICNIAYEEKKKRNTKKS